mmetsp:Transcript_37356/g.86227  ORF Transcript_37356/g.86227 Transcript_37356/m.86227 type:complete len:250 (+) Transcript_37356:267-1016(+)
MHKGSLTARLRDSLVVGLAATPLLGDGLVLVEDVSRHVVQVLLLHGAHLRPNVAALDGRVDLRDVLQTIIGGGIVQVIHQAFNGGSAGLGTTELLDGKADVLVGTGTTADVAGGARRVEQTLATDQLLLGQSGGLALVIHWNDHVLHVGPRRARRSGNQGQAKHRPCDKSHQAVEGDDRGRRLLSWQVHPGARSMALLRMRRADLSAALDHKNSLQTQEAEAGDDQQSRCSLRHVDRRRGRAATWARKA